MRGMGGSALGAIVLALRLADSVHACRKRLPAASPSHILCYESELLHAVHHLLTGDPSLVRVSTLEAILRHLAHSYQAEAS